MKLARKFTTVLPLKAVVLSALVTASAPASAQTIKSAVARYFGIARRAAAGSRQRLPRTDRRAGLDLRGESRTVRDRALGDTALLWDQDSRLAGFAVCH